MGKKINIKAEFDRDGGRFFTEKGGVFEYDTEAGPYDYFMGALAGCLHHTFVGVAEKMKASWETLDVKIEAEKRDETPTTLKHVEITFTFGGVEDRKKIAKAFEIATRYCSIYQTCSKVADEIVPRVEFV